MFVSVIELFPLGYQYINKIMDMDTVEKDKFISELSDFTVAALNEKWERDFGERSDDPEDCCINCGQRLPPRKET
ncbi:MAG: hypothetical protein LBB81_01415 [Treponema sp.]|nr:hypothetical protein [Treponema sp.]